MGPLSIKVVTSYRLPIVTIGLSLTVFTVLRLVTDGRKWSSKKVETKNVVNCAINLLSVNYGVWLEDLHLCGKRVPGTRVMHSNLEMYQFLATA